MNIGVRRFVCRLPDVMERYRRIASETRKREYDYGGLLSRMENAAARLPPLLKEASATIKVSDCGHRPVETPVEKKTAILLLKDVFKLSNRQMASMTPFLAPLQGIRLSYKTVERSYSDPLVRLVLHNLFMALVDNVKEADVCGDGTGYSLTITKHYRTCGYKQNGRKKAFAYFFALMDLHTKLYIGYGTSMKSEKEAFKTAVKMMHEVGIKEKSVRLDRYYSGPSTFSFFAKSALLYLIPKKNATIRGVQAWKDMLRRMIEDPYGFLSEYYKRNNSESGFASDKIRNGWKVWQKREDRIKTSLICKAVWHNLMWGE